jgi:hypothetical protein
MPPAEGSDTAALVISHPGHELCVYRWLETARPDVFVLTDGSGRSGISRLNSTTKVIASAGASAATIYGRFSDRDIYAALLQRDFGLFERLVTELAEAFVRTRIECVAGDAIEGYNPIHDACRLVIDAAVEIASRMSGRRILGGHGAERRRVDDRPVAAAQQADRHLGRGNRVLAVHEVGRFGELLQIVDHRDAAGRDLLIRFPTVPAIYVCHSFSTWLEAPVHFPQIGAYVAVDEACRDRLVHSEGIAPERVVILRNAVDLKRVPARPRELPAHPRSALAFAKACNVPQIAAACEKLGIAHHAIGHSVGRVAVDPEQELIKSDLVFASARGALEALCCGCAVIACDGRGMAGLVTSRNYHALRKQNFGLRSLNEPVTVERCVEEIGRYDRDDAVAVADLARRDADLEVALDGFEKLYAEVRGGTAGRASTRQSTDVR